MGVAAVLACGLAMTTAGPALADTYDDEFIAKLSRAGSTFGGDDAKAGAIEMAAETCDLLGRGYSNNEATNVMVNHYGKIIPDTSVMKIMGMGVLHYCPELMG